MTFSPMEMAQEGRWLISMTDTNWIEDNQIKFDSSFHVVGARLMGLTYPEYLHYLQSCSGELKGKEGYTFVYFKDKKQCQKVCKELDRRWTILKGRIE